MFRDHATLHGRVERVIDGDTIRVRHAAWYPLPFGQRYVGRLSDHTLSIRAYGVDSPEIGKFGKPSQAFAVQAKEFTKQLLQGRMVTIKLLRKDQYDRAVAKVQVSGGWLPFLQRDLSIELAERGFAVMYTGRGAEYDVRLYVRV
jgi:endonuclease YncB( thermonuclease family)